MRSAPNVLNDERDAIAGSAGWATRCADGPAARPLLARLARSPDVEMRLFAAMHDATPAAAVARLAHDEELEIRDEATANPTCARWELARLAAGNTQQAVTVASNPNLGPAVLSGLLEDPRAKVQAAAAANRAADPAAVTALAERGDWLSVGGGGVRERGVRPAGAVPDRPRRPSRLGRSEQPRDGEPVDARRGAH